MDACDVFDRVSFETDAGEMKTGYVRDVIWSEVGPQHVGLFYTMMGDDGQLYEVEHISCNCAAVPKGAFGI